MKTRKICPLATRIKKMMQTDDDVGKISQATPILIGRAMELFLEKLCRQAITVAQSRQAKTLTPSHLKAAVKADTTLDFLTELVAPAPDLPAAEAENAEAAPKPAKRRRTNDSGDGPTSPEGRGRGRSSAAATTSGQASDDTPPGVPSKARGSKPPLAPGAQATASRGAGGPKKESTGRRGPRVKAAAAVAAEASEPGSSSAAEFMDSASPTAGAPVGQEAPGEANVPGTAAAASVKAPRRREPVVKQDDIPRHEPAGPRVGVGAAPTGGVAAGGAGSFIVASLRAQQPFFGLGRKGKNLGSKGSSGAAAPSPACTPGHQLQQVSPAHPTVEASACTTGSLAPSTDEGLIPQLATSYPLKLEPLDLSTVLRSGHETGAARMKESSPASNGNGPGTVLDACGSINGPGGQTAPSLQCVGSGAAGLTSTTTGLDLGTSGDAGLGSGRPEVEPSGGQGAGVAQPALGGSWAGSALAPFGASMAYFQAPQQQGDMDDDYDVY